MILSQRAFHLLTAKPVDWSFTANKPGFPDTCDGLEFKSSESGHELYHNSEFFSIIIQKPIRGVRAEAKLFYVFYKRCFSNFSFTAGITMQLDGKPIRAIKCGEQFFKLYCALLHLSNAESSTEYAEQPDEHERVCNDCMSVVANVLNGGSPATCKAATNALKPFLRQKWDDYSFDVMVHAQKWKCTDFVYFHHMNYVRLLCEKHDVALHNVGFFEASPMDKVWGTGSSTGDLTAQILASLSANDGKTWFLTDPSGCPEHKDRPFEGLNKLGRALQLTFWYVVGRDGDGIHETHHEYIARLGSVMPDITVAKKFDPETMVKTDLDDGDDTVEIIYPTGKRPRDEEGVTENDDGRCLSDTVASLIWTRSWTVDKDEDDPSTRSLSPVSQPVDAA